MKTLFSIPKMRRFGLNQSLKGLTAGTLLFVGTTPLALKAAANYSKSAKQATADVKDDLQDRYQDLQTGLDKLGDKMKSAAGKTKRELSAQYDKLTKKRSKIGEKLSDLKNKSQDKISSARASISEEMTELEGEIKKALN